MVDAAVAIPLLAALAFALVAIVIRDAVSVFVVGPTRAAANSAAGIPVVGGPIAWALTVFADATQGAIDTLWWFVERGKSDAFNAWTTLSHYTIWVFIGWYLSWSQWIADRSAGIQWVLDNWWGVEWQAYTVLPGWIAGVADDLRGLRAWVDSTLLPMIFTLDYRMGTVEALINNLILSSISGLLARVAALEQFVRVSIQTEIAVGLRGLSDRIGVLERDVPTRALEQEAQALRSRVGKLEQQVAILGALAVLAVVGADAIENLRCLSKTPCDPINALLGADVDERVTALEYDHG